MVKDVNRAALEQAEKFGGKLEVVPKVAINTREDLSIAYSPGVGAVSSAIAKNPDLVYTMTTKKNTVAIISDGSSVLGLGNIGAKAAMPVMEGKAALFKRFADVDAVPIVLDTQDVDEIVQVIKAIAPTFGGIHLEDISAPRCLEIEQRLIKELDIPVFHDDQHGTAIVVLAGVFNALKLKKLALEDARFVINGAGAAGLAITRKFLYAGAKHVIVCDKVGILSEDQAENLPAHHAAIARETNQEHRHGTLQDALVGADVFIGVSAPGVLKAEWISSMNDKAVIFAMANPDPEIYPDEALEAGAYIVGTGRSDFPNQINNVLAFPGIFRGALDARSRDITNDMQIAAARGIASLVSDDELAPDHIIPDAFKEGVTEVVAESVRRAAQ